MKKYTNKQSSRFSLIEILIVLAIISILFALLMPSLYKAKIYAKYVRWYTFNRSCSNDPNCIINFNFQGVGDTFSQPPPENILINSAAGADVDGFSPQFYNGYLMSKNGGPHNLEWVRAGRFGDFKWALRFNGSDTYVVIPTTNAIDFTPSDSFTILCWVKFDRLKFGDTIFAKSLWGIPMDSEAQYDMYYNPYSGDAGNGSFDVDVFTTCGTWFTNQVNFEEAGWVHFALRYKSTGMDENGKLTGEVSAFINGKSLGPYIDTTNDNPRTGTATGFEGCIHYQVPLILGGAGCKRKYYDPGTYNKDDESLANQWSIHWNFQGLMDEFLLYKRALTDKEIAGFYEMGKE
jgi:prepilin-type N-terminal cleavage/methylation domain-containing protein